MRSSLELLLLSFVCQGLRTPYDLKARAGLSLGSTIPALERLNQAKLLKCSKGPRGSNVYEITLTGVKALETGWKDLSIMPVSDSDAVLRTAFLVWKYGSSDKGSDLLRSAAQDALGRAKVARVEADRLKSGPTYVSSDAYCWLRSNFEAARLEGEAKAFIAISGELARARTKRRSRAQSK
jgi:DNA-binding PadR family transcriptional regulator